DVAVRADVSPRTFFNYFETKEDAILGISSTATAEILADFGSSERTGGSAIDVVVELIWLLLSGSIISEETLGDRMELLRANPALSRRSFDRLSEMEAELITALDAHLAADFDAASPQSRHDFVMVLLSTGMGIWRYILHKLLDGASPADGLAGRDDFTKTVQAYIASRRDAPGSWVPDFSLIREIQNEYLAVLTKILG
ncbi:MAG: TetR/AcrR family transcriptional regulator, partial [Propionibacteriaceae bacterium]|nr:TetR/AcrR family transcriptional regulator [Propionibacteriaceae bacterium]